jgi:alpha-beta hydrolase superfamily lysophospholipase
VQPGQYQQTLKTSFTVGGLGLHSGEYGGLIVDLLAIHTHRTMQRVMLTGSMLRLMLHLQPTCGYDQPTLARADTLSGCQKVLERAALPSTAPPGAIDCSITHKPPYVDEAVHQHRYEQRAL